MIMYNVPHLSTTPLCGPKRLIRPESRVISSPVAPLTSPPSIVKTIVEDVKMCHDRSIQNNDEGEARQDSPMIVRVAENERIFGTPMVATMEEQHMSIRRHRRTYATNWDELMSRLDNSNIRGIQPRKHRRSFALTEDEFTEITMVCDELHGIMMPLHL